jgi:probable selenium-dependent hydroxylase accessory protein YqeC
VTLLGEKVREDKWKGLSPGEVDALRPLCDLVLVEADGARGRSLKLPAEYEPVLPGTTGEVVVLAGLDAVDAPLDEGLVHRLPLVVEALGAKEGSRVDLDAFVRVLSSPLGYLSRRPPGARMGVFLNKARGREGAAEAAARRLLLHFDRVAIGEARTGEASFLAGGAGV